jgi:hypothetical protein
MAFVFTIGVVLVAPWGIAATGLLLFSGLAVAAIRLLDRNIFHPIISDGLPTIDPGLSWPNSGFRNIGRGTKGG